MGTIAEKLSYLADTKDLFKDRLNSLGAEIIESTTFRNYLTWLDTFYGEVSDKTDLSINGIVGRTSQESTTGKNVFKKANDLYNNMRDTGQFTLADMGNNVLKATKNTTGTTSPRFYITDSIVSSTTYYVSLDALGNCNSLKVGIWSDGAGQTDLATITPTNNYQKISFSFTSTGTTTRIYFRNSDENIEVGQYFQIKNVMISTSNDTTYEPYTNGASPNSDYPQEINNLSGDVEYKVRGKNLFDINNALNNNLYNQGTSLSLITNGIRATTEAVANYRMSLIKIGETNKLIGKTIRVKANFSSNGNNNGRFYIGYCDASGENRVSKSDTTTSGNTLSMVVESGSGENICLVLYSNQSATNYTIGNYVDYKNIIMTIDNEDMTYEPHISESFPLSLKSKNLFDKNNANIIKCGISYHKINASDSNRLLYISIQPNTTYTIQRRNDGNVNRFRAGTCSIVPANGVDLDNAIETDDAKSITITSRENDTYLAVMYYRTQETTLTEQQILDSIQIEEGSTPTDYEPYYDIELCNISNYEDQIYSQNGEFYLEKKNDKIVFDGSESWSINTSYTYNVFYRTLNNYARISNTQTTYCEYYKGIENAGGIANFGNNYNNSIGVRTANDNIKDIYISNNSITSERDFKTWLSTHNTVVYYVLATPATTEITQENYPTLYSQLLAIQEFLTKYKINKEFLLDYSSPEIEY